MFRSLVLAFGIAFAVVLVAVTVSERAGARSFEQLRAAFTHELDLSDASRNALRTVLDLEAAERGFVMIGDEKALVPFADAQRQLPGYLAAWRRLIEDDPEARALVDGLEARIAAWVAEYAEPEIAARRRAGHGPVPEAVSAMLARLGGKQLVDDARVAGRKMRALATARRETAEHEIEAQRRTTWRILVAAAAGAGLLVFLIGVRLTRRLERSVTWLAKAAVRIGAGDFAVETPPRDEVPLLAGVKHALVAGARALAERDVEAQTLLTLSREIGGAGSVQALADMLYASLPPVIAPIRVGIGAIDGTRVRHVAISPVVALSPEAAEWHERAPNSLVGELLRTRAAVVNNDVAARHWAEDEAVARFGASAYVLVPVSSGERIFATIGVGLETGRFTERQVRFLDTLGQQVARQIEAVELRDALERRNGELERATRAKSEFLAMMSHELRTPLNSVIGFSEVLVDGKFGVLNERQARFTQNVLDSGRHLLGLINGLLDLAKIEAGRLEVSPEAVAPREIAEQAIVSLQPIAEARQVAVTLAEGRAPAVWADPVRLKQILYNFLANAIKFSPVGERVEVRVLERDEVVRIEVIDRGPGIAAADLELLFQPFSQLRSPGAPTALGSTGLGLAVARQLATLMDGQVGVASEVGVGSTFFVELPVDVSLKLPRVEAPPAVAADAPLALIVDDDDDARELLALTLHAAGYRTAAASTGVQAVAAARALAPQVITLDVFLPGLDGWEVLRALGADARTWHIPVVMVTISSDRDKAFALGAHEHLVKPVDRAALVDALERRRWLPVANAHRARVLLIDDDARHHELVRAELEPRGIEVLSALDGKVGLEVALRQPQVDAVILDLVMPGLSGIEVVDALRKEEHTRAVPIVLLTSKTIEPAERSRLEENVQGILGKGQGSMGALVTEIARVMRRPL